MVKFNNGKCHEMFKFMEKEGQETFEHIITAV